MLHYDSLMSIDRFYNTGLCTMNYFDLSSSVSLTFDGVTVSPHNRRARADFPHHISTYTLRYTQIADSSFKLDHVWGSFSHKVP